VHGLGDQEAPGGAEGWPSAIARPFGFTRSMLWGSIIRFRG
jgi:hypothetical protein